MTKMDRLYQLHQILDGRRTPISKAELAEQLECSEKSVGRYLNELRDEYGAPIINVRQGWFYDRRLVDRWQMPGLWLTKQETQSLLLLLILLERFGNGLMSQELESIRARIANLTARHGMAVDALRQRIRIMPIGNRETAERDLSRVVNALIDRKRIHFRYEDFRGTDTRRVVSPQRLAYYRDNWYLHGWCHERKALRTFSIARMGSSAVDERAAREVDEAELDAHFESSYGVFAGRPEQIARLRFLQPVATEISRQRWHADQKGRWDDSQYLLAVPYSHATELLQDVLRYLPHVIVEGPTALRDQLREVLAEAQSLNPGTG